MFVFRLDPSSGVPPYLQLVQQVRQALLLGFLQPGDRLPLIREVVESLAINPNTVAKAYRQLEHEDLVTGRPGQGTFVTAYSRGNCVARRVHLAAPRAAELVAPRLRRRVGRAGGQRAFFYRPPRSEG